MTKRPRQDDSAENTQIGIFDLEPGPGRSNKYVPDGYIKIGSEILSIELKSTSEKKGQFSTSSRMGKLKIQAWKNKERCDEGKRKGFDYMILSVFDKDGVFIEHIICSHKDLQPFYDKVNKKQQEGHAGRAGMNSWHKARKRLESDGWTEKELDALEKQNLFGSRMNDPGISWKEARQWGIKINNKNPRQHLREILKKLDK